MRTTVTHPHRPGGTTSIEVPPPLSTSVSGMLKGAGGVVAAAVAGTDYVAPDDPRIGVGIPTGGDATQVLAKKTSEDYDTEWVPAGTPAAHASSHGSGQADAISIANTQVSGLGNSSTKDVGTGSTQVAAGDHNHSGTYAAASHTHMANQVSDASTLGQAILTASTIYKSLYIDAGAMKPATASTQPEPKEYVPASGDTSMDGLYFDSATSEAAQFKLVMPEDWDRGTIKIKFVWATTASGTDGVVWDVLAGAVSNDDALGTTVLGTHQQVADTNTAANDLLVTAATPALTVGGTPALADMVFFKVQRLPADSSDTLAADAILLGVWIQYSVLTTLPAAW